MIYSRFGCECEIVRRGTLEDVRTFDKRKPDADDRANVANGCYVIIRYKNTGEEALAAQCYLRADDGSKEITDALRAIEEVSA